MKLTKYKVGLLSLAIVLSVGMLLGVSLTALAETYTIDNQTEFSQITGEYLSEIGDPWNFQDGDVIELDFADEGWEVTQTQSLFVNLEVTIKPSDDDETVVLNQVEGWEGFESNGPSTTAYEELYNVPDNVEVDAAIVVLSSGVKLESLEFKPTNNPGEYYSSDGYDPKSYGIGPANAIEVDCCGYDSTKSLRFYNLEMPVSGADGGFVHGFKFDGSVSDLLKCNTGATDYTGGIYFRDVRLDGNNSQGIQGNGVVFTENVGNVANVEFEELYGGYIVNYPDTSYSGVDGSNPSGNGGNGILFNNSGTVKDVTLMDSERKAPSVSEDPFSLEENFSNGLMINTGSGDSNYVSGISGLELNYTRLENNGGAGIFVQGRVPDDGIDPVSLGMAVKNTLITGNNYGILVAQASPSTTLDSQDYIPVRVDGVHLGDNLTVHNNPLGGALFMAQVVDGSKSSPAFTVSDSQFHRGESETNSDVNDQDFGLIVDTYEGIFGVEISDSTFRYHGQSTVSGAGIELLTPGPAYYDRIEGVTIKNTSSLDNGGPGLAIEANVVDNVDILSSDSSTAKFSGNGLEFTDENDLLGSGIDIYGQTRVTDLTITGEAGGGEVLANYNAEYGLLVKSEEEISGVEVANAQFGDDYNDDGNGNSGVKLATTGSNPDEFDIGSNDQAGAISFDNVEASDNDGHGIEISSVSNFINPSDNVLVNSSEFRENKSDGLHLYAAEDVRRPRVENSTFVGNNITGGTAGIFVEAGGGEVVGTGDGDIVGNVLANNEIGVAVTDSVIEEDDDYVDTIIDFSVKGNTTVHPDDSGSDGNRWANVVLAADNLNTVTVEDNNLVSAYTDDQEEPNTDYGLWLEANESSASLSVKANTFDSGAEGFCVGIGTAIHLDAKKTSVRQNEIVGFDTALEVLQESSGSSTAGDTSNHINDNNINGCCTLINATALDYDNGEKVDATSNYWGEDITKSDLEPNLKTDSTDPFDQIFVEPLRTEPVEMDEDLQINISVTPETPDVNETVELEYELVNTTGTSMSLSEVRLTLTDADDEFIDEDKLLKSDVTVPADDSKTFTYEFETTSARGEYEAEISADDYTETFLFDVGEVEPEVKTPFWGSDADSSESGILPAPVGKEDGETPFLELANEDGDSVHSYVTINVLRVFDLGGRKILEVEENFDDLSELENLENGLYLYTVDYEVSGESGTQKSPVMRFLVRN
ncbi:hypothetical protein K9M78_02210 [Candidatus Bipolaricaulota bacterium]|nr:hypothetical protein [Candidatus Bipolaricaulota bacterium]